jgi:large subunit ribosomal protein L28
MAKCDICGKGVAFGNQASHSNIKTRRTWGANIKKVRAIVNGTPKRVNICTRCLRSGKIERAI